MKRNGWKKLLATAGVMSLTVGCLSGCGGEPQGNPQTGSTQPGSQAQEQSQEQSQEAPGSHIPAGRAGGTYHSHAGRRSGFPGRQSSYMGGDPETHQH